MANPTPAFPLRLRDPSLRDLLRRVAEHDGISQNELVEQALSHELLIRGATVADDLAQAAESLVELTDAHYEQAVTRSLHEFARGEAGPEPLQAHAFERVDDAEASADPLGVLSAFDAPLHEARRAAPSLQEYAPARADG